MNKQKELYRCCTLLDTCASKNFISEGLAKKLQLSKKRCHIPIGAINNTSTVAKYCITATIRSQSGNYVRSLPFIIIPTISDFIPEELINRRNLKIQRNIKLADPTFHRPSPVDMLLGAGPTLSMICIGQINLTTPDKPDLHLQKTRFGWVIGRSAPSASSPSDQTALTSHEDTLRNNPPSCSGVCHFTPAKDPPNKPGAGRFASMQRLQPSESAAAYEEYFRLYTIRNSEGRYVVALPFNNKKQQLGESRTQAERRLLSSKRKLQRDSDLRQQYHAVLQEYLDIGHLSEIKQSELHYGITPRSNKNLQSDH